MALNFRSIFTMLGNQEDSQEIVLEQFNEWLMKDPVRQPRNLNRDLYRLNSVTIFNPETELIYFEHTTQDGNRILRARLIENKKDSGRWISTLTLLFPKRQSLETIVMYEGDAPMETDRFGNRRPQWIGSPRLVHRILDVADAYDVVDPQVPIFKTPRIINDTNEVEDLFDALCDPERKTSIFVSASKNGEAPSSKLKNVTTVMHNSVGTASAYILSPMASKEFNRTVGNDHGVWYDNSRLYIPDFDPAVSLNARNHPLIKIGQLAGDRIDATGLFVGFIARRELINKPLKSLKRDLARIEEILVDREYELLISGEKIHEKRYTVSATPVNSEVLPKNVLESLKIYDDLREAIGIQEPTPDDIKDITAKIQGYELIAERLKAANAETREYENRVGEISDDRDDALLQYAETYEELKKLRDKVKYLQIELMRSDRNESAWLDTPSEMITKEPVSFEELIQKISELEYVEFTGDASIAIQLDVTELGARSGRIWNEILGLNDYCRAQDNGLVNGGIKEYIERLPNDYKAITETNYRAKESASVEANPKLRNQRLLPVPSTVDQTGEILMYSHLTIGKRLHVHFYEDFAKSRKIYIGRIGPHLDTASTN